MNCDLLIIGGGPAGLTAGIFASRAGLDSLLIEKLAIGGQAALSYDIANYPGFESIAGFELTERMRLQAEIAGLKIDYGTVRELRREKGKFVALCLDKKIYADQVIIACGAKARKLNLQNEQELIGKGISYCASCDGRFFKGKTVVVNGGGNTAIEDVDYLARLAKKIYLVHRRDCFRANDLDVARVRGYKNVEIITNATITAILGKSKLLSVEIDHNGTKKKLNTDGLFVAIGYEPDIDFIKLKIKTDQAGYIIVNKNMQTNIKKVYAAGDITGKYFKQVISACSDGAMAANSAINAH